jgi:hypothetical protein
MFCFDEGMIFVNTKVCVVYGRNRTSINEPRILGLKLRVLWAFHGKLPNEEVPETVHLVP